MSSPPIVRTRCVPTDSDNRVADAAEPLRQLAFFYEPFWRSGAAATIKTLLLFFDGIALTVPEYAWGAPLAADPALEMLEDQGLLVRLSPEFLIDTTTAESLARVLVELLTAGAFGNLDRKLLHRRVSALPMGARVEPLLTENLLAELAEHGLATQGLGGAPVSVHPTVRSWILAALPQLVRESAEHVGCALQPITTHPQQAHALLDCIDRAPLAAAAHVVATGLQPIGPDLTRIPIIDVLAFREEHTHVRHAFIRKLRNTLVDIAITPPDESSRVFLSSCESLASAADDLRRMTPKAWGQPSASCLLGIAGGAISYIGPNIAGQMSAGATLFGLGRRSDPGSAFTYLCAVTNQAGPTHRR